MMKKTRLTTALCLGSLALAGCSTTPTATSTSGLALNDQTPIYGYLTQAGEGYQFTRFTMDREDIRNDLPWVRLNDFEPMWNTDAPESCGESATMRPSWCERDNPALFMEAEVDGSALGGTAAVATLTMGLSLLGGLPMEPTFQEGDFQDAVDDAKGRIPNFDATMRQIQQKLNVSESQAFKDYQSQPAPKVNFNAIDQMPRLSNGESLLGALSDVYVSSFPEVTVKAKPATAALGNLGEFQSLEQLHERLPSPGEATFTYSAECDFTNSILRMDFNCPSDIPAHLDEVTVDFFVMGAIVTESTFPVVEKNIGVGLTLKHDPTKLNPWVIHNHSDLPASLRSMTVKLGYREATIDLRSQGVIMPGQEAEFEIDQESYDKILRSLRYSEMNNDKRVPWTVIVRFIPQGFNEQQLAVFDGSNTTKELVEQAVAVRKMKRANASKTLNARLSSK